MGNVLALATDSPPSAAVLGVLGCIGDYLGLEERDGAGATCRMCRMANRRRTLDTLNDVYFYEDSLWTKECDSMRIANIVYMPDGKNFDFTTESRPALAVVPTEHKGYGLYAAQVIPSNKSILRYCGEMIKSAECVRRYQGYDVRKLNYVLTMKEIENRGENPATIVTNIDATLKGGVARYINHSCDPNLEVVMDRDISAFDGSNRPPNLIGVPTFVSRRVIVPGEELTFDYASSDLIETLECRQTVGEKKRSLSWGVHPEGGKKRKRFVDSRAMETSAYDTRVPCYCGEKACRGWLLISNH